MQLYEHVNDEGEVTERVRPVAGSKNAAALARKADDPASGWREVDETPAATTTPARPRSTTSATPAAKTGEEQAK